VKTILAFILLTFSVAAQHYDLLQTKQGDFKDCTIIRTNPAYVVVSHDGSLTRVAITNLPALVQERIGYDPAKAAASLAAEQAHTKQVRMAQIAQQKYLASLAGTNQTVRCVSIQDAFGLCTIQILEWNTNSESYKVTETRRVYMSGLPASVSGYFSAVQRLSNQAAGDAADADQMKRDAERADASAPTYAAGSVTYVNAAMAQRTRANNMALDANEAAKDAAASQQKLLELQAQGSTATMFTAFNTGLKDNGIERWQAVSF
jgi:hypothetical protein